MVCVPLYDYERYVLGALDSVYHQSLSPLALTVVDDGSNDGGAARVLSWMETHCRRFSRVRLLQHPRNVGLAEARNTAIRDATSPFVFLLDADNELYPACLERLLDALGRGNGAFAYSILEQFGTVSQLVGCDAWSREQIARGNYVDAMSMVRKSAWETVGGYRATRVPGWEDYDFWCRNAEAEFDGILVPQILCRYRVHDESMLRRTTDTLRNHLGVCEEMLGAHPWIRLGGRPGGRGAWRTSPVARGVASVPPVGRIPVAAIDLFSARVQRVYHLLRNGGARARAAAESWRAGRALGRLRPDARAVWRTMQLCLDPTIGTRLQSNEIAQTAATARATSPSLESAALLGAGLDAVPAEAAKAIRVAVYASSQGNFFFREMAAHLAGGLNAAGCFEVSRHDELGDPPDDVDEHLIVAPHEFFGLGRGRRFRGESFRAFRRASTLFLAEQLGTKHFAFCMPFAVEARLVLDLSPGSAAVLRGAGARATFFPLGYLPDHPLFDQVRDVSALDLRRLGLGCGLDSEPRARPDSELESGSESQGADAARGDWLSHRPIDILFNGVFTPRRSRFFAEHAAFFSRRRCCLLLPTPLRPLERSVPSALETREATALARRAKIQLNIHRVDFPYFEWHRLVVRGFWNRSLVVSEPCAAPAGFEPGVHYLEAPLAEIPEFLGRLLDTSDGREQAERIRTAAFEQLCRRFDLRDWARSLAGFYASNRSDTGRLR